jgi:hypothetical protein
MMTVTLMTMKKIATKILDPSENTTIKLINEKDRNHARNIVSNCSNNINENKSHEYINVLYTFLSIIG